MGEIQGPVHRRDNSKGGKKRMERLAKRRRKKDAQLWRRDKSSKVPVFEVSEEEFEIRNQMAMLPPLASTGCRMEWEIPHVLRRPSPKGSIWRPNERNCKRGLAKIRPRKTIAFKGNI